MKNEALKYYMHDGPAAFQFELSGELNDSGARRLEQDWRTASSAIGSRRLNIDITFVTGISEKGKALLSRWYGEGARIIANSNSSRALAKSIACGWIPEPAVIAFAEQTWAPFHTATAAMLALLVGLLFPTSVSAASLKPETIAAWDAYVKTETVKFDSRLRPGASFLWTFEDGERAEKVRSGEIVVAPVAGASPKKVPGGLIHHWQGAMFLPGLRLDDALDVTSDYDHYKDFYKPSVIDSKVIAHAGADDRFSMLLMNKALFSHAALDADYEATNLRLDDRRFYRVSKTTRVQEIEDYNQAGEHKVAEGEGSGYIWKLYSVARFEQKDQGVYVELEVIALSRDIPGALRFVVDPIVRRVSRSSLQTSLQQTAEAVRGATLLAKSAGGSSTVGHAQGASAMFAKKSAATSGIR